jgi:tetratricopeptide (TPR) repeat protein
MSELAGELYLAAGNRESAFQAYSLLVRAPWPASQLKANAALGTIRLEEDRLDDAKRFFQTVIASQDSSQGTSQEVLRAKTKAEVGLAKCLVREGDWKTAIKQLETLSIKTDSEDARLQAPIYLALGEAHEAAENPKEAILTYLHVEILFPSAKSEYVAALKRLAVLWTQVNRPERAAEAERILKSLE